MFLFNPFFILSIIGLIPLWRAHREWALFVFAAFLGCLFIHAMLPTFHGNWCWGPRYLCRQIPLLFIPLAFFAWKPAPANSAPDLAQPKIFPVRRWAFGVVMTVSVLVQIIAVSGNHSRELTDMSHARGEWSARQWTMFEPEANILKFRVVNLYNGVKDMINGEIAPWPTEPKRLRSLQENLNAPVNHYLAYWPFHLTYYLPAVKSQYALPLWASTLILITGTSLGLLLLFLGYHRLSQHKNRHSKLI